MSAGRSDEVDIDLLADYVGGALDGTAEERVVARLIADDGRWAQAYARLVRDGDTVRRTLAEWGDAPEPMPPDIVERLSARLASAGAAAESAVDRGDDAATSRPAPTRPLGRSDADSTRPAVRKTRRRLPRWATPVAVAAALLAVAGLGVSQLGGDIRTTDNTTGALSRDEGQPQGAEGGPAAAQPHTAAEASSAQVLATGTDYTRGALANQVDALRWAAAGRVSVKETEAPAVPDASDLKQPATTGATGRGNLTACLSSIAGEHGRGTLHVEVIDYARFEGQPALVVVFTDPAGQRWVWAVAPECGQPSAGAAARYTARVG